MIMMALNIIPAVARHCLKSVVVTGSVRGTEMKCFVSIICNYRSEIVPNQVWNVFVVHVIS